MTAKTTTRKATKAAPRLCLDGCGVQVVRKTSNYAPGHDARHAGQVAREVASTGNAALVTALPTEALRTKATAMAARLVAKATKPSKSVKASTVAVESVKVGRWTYPARNTNGTVERNTKRDGSGEWVAV